MVVEACVALALPHVAVHVAVQQCRCEEVRRSLRLREVDVLTDTGAPAVIERGRELVSASRLGDVIDFVESASLTAESERRIAAALEALSPHERIGAERFLRLIVDAPERDKVARLIRK